MRYVRIRAQNFLSHLDTELRFNGYDAVTVIGPNGSGKSSFMVDCPLVAAFGKGRSGDMDGYVKIGKDVMTVEFDFSIHGEIYRIVRKRSIKTSRGITTVEFYQIDEAGNVVRPLTAGSVGETEEIIRKTMGTDFDTIVRTSIIEQSEADVFCKATPSERMELFAQAWDLEKYDELAQMSRDQSREKKDKLKVLDDRVMANSQRIREIDKYAEELGKLKALLVKETTQANGIDRKKETLQKKIGTFAGMEGELAKAREYKVQADRNLKTIGDQHTELITKIERYVKILKNRETVLLKVEEEKTVAGEIERADSEIKKLNDGIEEIRTKEESVRVKEEAEIARVEASKREIDRSIDAARTRMGDANKELAGVGRKEEQLKQMCLDADKLKGVQCHPEHDPSYVNETCRFIKDAVFAKKKIPELEREISEQKKVAEKAYAEADLCIATLSENKKKIEKEVVDLRHKLDVELQKFRKVVADKKNERLGLENTVKEKKAAIEDIKRYTKLLPEITLAETETPKLKEDERNLSDRCNEILNEIENGKKDIERLTKEMAGKTDVERELQSVCKTLDEAVARKDELTKRIGAIEGELPKREELKTQCEADEKDMELISADKAILDMLEDGFRQIPYMLVSRGVGAVEAITNEILTMISSNGLRIEIKTEKMGKSTKKVRDEINLAIVDNDGPKQYKFLSGGEKLRVALAFRIAIGEVFAHRRGVSIESLIADEPFNELDDEGVENMKDALRELRGRFGFLAAVSHITESKDTFPTRIEFSRGENRATVVEVSAEE